MQKYIVTYNMTQQSCNNQNMILTSHLVFLANKLNSILISMAVKLYTSYFKPYIHNCTECLVSQSAQPVLFCIKLNDRQMSPAMQALINVHLKPPHCNLETMQCKNETSESLCNPMSTSIRSC